MRPDPQAVCIGCGHYWHAHNIGVGCLVGWTYSDEGVAIGQGCGCELAHIELSSKEVR